MHNNASWGSGIGGQASSLVCQYPMSSSPFTTAICPSLCCYLLFSTVSEFYLAEFKRLESSYILQAFPCCLKNTSSIWYQHSRQNRIKLPDEISKKSVNAVREALVKINLFSLGINWILASFGNVEFMLGMKYVNKSYIALARSKASWRGNWTWYLLICGSFTSIHPEVSFAEKNTSVFPLPKTSS